MTGSGSLSFLGAGIGCWVMGAELMEEVMEVELVVLAGGGGSGGSEGSEGWGDICRLIGSASI